ncbi:hypothetical protein [Syntrophotalea acetylenivorans]|uniref:hypothetical protein n=1 Tax=Syntrophotalea acetylenivorans TaxID=1842532 RepID=UPI0013145934|nr:hypothetical protein [Syntrophotalea acetylenivorans]
MSESMSDEKLNVATPEPESEGELERLCRDIERQIRSNQRFLEGFMNENLEDEEE